MAGGRRLMGGLLFYTSFGPIQITPRNDKASLVVVSGDRSASAAIRKQLDWVVEAAHRIFADAFEIEIAFDEVSKRAGQQHRSPQLFGEGFETRSHVDCGTDNGEVEPGARPDIAVHDISDVDADTVIQRCKTGFAVLFVQGNHGLTGFGHGMQQICAGRRLAEGKNGEHTVADEFQYFPAMSRNWLRHRVEIAVSALSRRPPSPSLRELDDLDRQRDLKVIVFRHGCSYRQRLENLLTQRGIQTAKPLEFSSLDAILGCVAAGVGITLLPKAVVASSWKEGLVLAHELPPEEARVTTMFIRRSDVYASSALNAFLAAARPSPLKLVVGD